ncbi:MAG: CoA transferase [Burkholderiaceae bacterium]|nr:CoA transferase [Burkholderiaceae bacterium]
MRVIELSQIMAGPTCGMMLADLGADVIKIERVPGGDDSRGYGNADASGAHLAHPFVVMNRNKRSLALDIRSPEGKAALLRLVDGADVLVENFRPGLLDRFGLGYQDLSTRNPRLIYCSISGYGGVGPMGDEGGFDMILQAFAGIMSVTGTASGEPVRPGSSVADVNAGLLGAIGVLAALNQRHATGRGQYVRSSLLEAALQQMYWYAAEYFESGRVLGPSGSAHPITAPYQAFRTADKYIIIGGANQANWERIARTLRHPEWIDDERFQTGFARKRNESTLASLIEAELAAHPAAHWVATLKAAGVPVGPMHTIDEALAHPQTEALGMVRRFEHPKAGPLRSLGTPVRLSASAPALSRGAPLLGEHSREVLREAGFDDDAIDAMARGGVTILGD